MKFVETPIAGLLVVKTEPAVDERGFFARTFCEREFAAQGLVSKFVQCSRSFNRQAGMLRGMHFQLAPHEETKLVRCTRGKILDVAVDLRSDSPTHGRHFAIELDEDEGLALYIPQGFAHGFQALRDSSEVYYQISEFYVPGSASGIRWNDPTLGIQWPIKDAILSERDRGWPEL